jgi:hypothetical protein
MASAFAPRKEMFFTIGLAEDTMLDALRTFHLLTAPQVCRLLYAPGSLTYVRSRLAALARAGYVEQGFLRRASRGGSTPLLYWLTGKGGRYLRSTGRDVRTRLRRSESRVYGYMHQAHSLDVSEFLLQARLFERRVPEVQLSRLIHERDMKQYAVKVTVTGGRTVQVVPDGFVEFVMDQPGIRHSAPVVLELDRGSHGVSSWSKKVEALAAWTKGAYQQVFGAAFLTIAIVVANDTWGPAELEHRRQQLRQWTEQVLDAAGERRLGEVFLFGCLSPATKEPERFFLEPAFLPAFGSTDVPLLDQGVSAA